MSYSRWSNSTWYTFWHDGVNTRFKLPTKKLKNLQEFQVCDVPSFTFTYAELQDKGLRGIITKIKLFYSKPHKGKMFKEWKDNDAVYEDTTFVAKKPSEEELRELMGYIIQWQSDVEKHFKFWNFMKYEWWYPFRNSVFHFFRNTKLKL